MNETVSFNEPVLVKSPAKITISTGGNQSFGILSCKECVSEKQRTLKEFFGWCEAELTMLHIHFLIEDIL